MTTALLVIFILVLLIVVHEFGHFLAAKFFGVRVDEFGIGYPPRALSFGRWGGTEYTLNWIPFGGFVRLFGEEEGAADQGSFAGAARYKQALILVAGVCGNVLAGWLLFAGAYHTGILHAVDTQGPGVQLMVTDVVTGSPADAAGLHVGDYVADIYDETGTHAETTPDGATSFFSARGGKDITIRYERGEEEGKVVVRPAHAVVPDEAQRPAVGIGLVLVTEQSVPWPQAMKEAAVSSYNTLRLVTVGLGALLAQAVHGSVNLQEVTGPVGLLGAVGQASQNGLGYLLSLAAFISLNLAVINLVPIPALDGGRLVIVGIEAVMRRPAPRLAIQLLNTIGIAAIILLMVAVTYNDILHLVL